MTAIRLRKVTAAVSYPPVDIVPTEVARDLQSFIHANGVLSIEITGVITSAREAQFRRVKAMDIAGINGAPDDQAFVYQETELTRTYLA